MQHAGQRTRSTSGLGGTPQLSTPSSLPDAPPSNEGTPKPASVSGGAAQKLINATINLRLACSATIKRQDHSNKNWEALEDMAHDRDHKAKHDVNTPSQSKPAPRRQMPTGKMELAAALHAPVQCPAGTRRVKAPASTAPPLKNNEALFRRIEPCLEKTKNGKLELAQQHDICLSPMLASAFEAYARAAGHAKGVTVLEINGLNAYQTRCAARAAQEFPNLTTVLVHLTPAHTLLDFTGTTASILIVSGKSLGTTICVPPTCSVHERNWSRKPASDGKDEFGMGRYELLGGFDGKSVPTGNTEPSDFDDWGHRLASLLTQAEKNGVSSLQVGHFMTMCRRLVVERYEKNAEFALTTAGQVQQQVLLFSRRLNTALDRQPLQMDPKGDGNSCILRLDILVSPKDLPCGKVTPALLDSLLWFVAKLGFTGIDTVHLPRLPFGELEMLMDTLQATPGFAPSRMLLDMPANALMLDLCAFAALQYVHIRDIRNESALAVPASCRVRLSGRSDDPVRVRVARYEGPRLEGLETWILKGERARYVVEYPKYEKGWIRVQEAPRPGDADPTPSMASHFAAQHPQDGRYREERARIPAGGHPALPAAGQTLSMDDVLDIQEHVPVVVNYRGEPHIIKDVRMDENDESIRLRMVDVRALIRGKPVLTSLPCDEQNLRHAQLVLLEDLGDHDRPLDLVEMTGSRMTGSQLLQTCSLIVQTQCGSGKVKDEAAHLLYMHHSAQVRGELPPEIPAWALVSFTSPEAEEIAARSFEFLEEPAKQPSSDPGLASGSTQHQRAAMHKTGWKLGMDDLQAIRKHLPVLVKFRDAPYVIRDITSQESDQPASLQVLDVLALMNGKTPERSLPCNRETFGRGRLVLLADLGDQSKLYEPARMTGLQLLETHDLIVATQQGPDKVQEGATHVLYRHCSARVRGETAPEMPWWVLQSAKDDPRYRDVITPPPEFHELSSEPGPRPLTPVHGVEDWDGPEDELPAPSVRESRSNRSTEAFAQWPGTLEASLFAGKTFLPERQLMRINGVKYPEAVWQLAQDIYDDMGAPHYGPRERPVDQGAQMAQVTVWRDPNDDARWIVMHSTPGPCEELRHQNRLMGVELDGRHVYQRSVGARSLAELALALADARIRQRTDSADTPVASLPDAPPLHEKVSDSKQPTTTTRAEVIYDLLTDPGGASGFALPLSRGTALGRVLPLGTHGGDLRTLEFRTEFPSREMQKRYGHPTNSGNPYKKRNEKTGDDYFVYTARADDGALRALAQELALAAVHRQARKMSEDMPEEIEPGPQDEAILQVIAGMARRWGGAGTAPDDTKHPDGPSDKPEMAVDGKGATLRQPTSYEDLRWAWDPIPIVIGGQQQTAEWTVLGADPDTGQVHVQVRSAQPVDDIATSFTSHSQSPDGMHIYTGYFAPNDDTRRFDAVAKPADSVAWVNPYWRQVRTQDVKGGSASPEHTHSQRINVEQLASSRSGSLLAGPRREVVRYSIDWRRSTSDHFNIQLQTRKPVQALHEFGAPYKDRLGLRNYNLVLSPENLARIGFWEAHEIGTPVALPLETPSVPSRVIPTPFASPGLSRRVQVRELASLKKPGSGLPLSVGQHRAPCLLDRISPSPGTSLDNYVFVAREPVQALADKAHAVRQLENGNFEYQLRLNPMESTIDFWVGPDTDIVERSSGLPEKSVDTKEHGLFPPDHAQDP